MKKIILFYVLLTAFFKSAHTSEEPIHHQADLIIFSYDRPLQLYAYLESLQALVTGLRNTFVLYRSSDDLFEKAYQEVKTTFPKIKFFKQKGQKPKKNFKPLLINILTRQSKARYVLFGVDDIVVTSPIDVCACTSAIQEYKSYGFYVRLGKNITSSYTQSVAYYSPPSLCEVSPGVFSWKFAQARYSWGLATSLDMTIVPKKTVLPCFKKLKYTTPNSLETAWMKHRSQNKKIKKKQRGLCYAHSKIVNLPFNVVGENKTSNNMQTLFPQDLLKIFMDGLKLDIAPLFDIKNKAPHMEYDPTFLARSQ